MIATLMRPFPTRLVHPIAKMLLVCLLAGPLWIGQAAANEVFNYEIARVRVKAGNQWISGPYSYTSGGTEPLWTQVYRDQTNVGQASQGPSWQGQPTWLFTYKQMPKTGSFRAKVKYNLYGTNNSSKVLISHEQMITIVPKIVFPSILVNEPTEGQTFPPGTTTVLLKISPFIPAKKPQVIRLEAQHIVGGQWTWTAPGATNYAWVDSPFSLSIPQPGSYRVRFSGDSGGYSGWRTFTVQ